MIRNSHKPVISSGAQQHSQQGFALVLALALLSFLFLLVLALISYIAVESRMSSSLKSYSLARAHAKLGLLVAIGELQQHAGPDQRVTATGAILDEDPYTPEMDAVDQPHWTGVWKRDPAALLTPSGQATSEPWDDPPNPNWDPHPEKELVWLVSGNENLDIKDSSYLRPSTGLPDPEYSSDSIWLVNNSVSQPEERVKASRASVLMSPNGLDASSRSRKTTGFYAFWVGDEGVKTKVNLPEATLQPDPENDFLKNIGRFQASPGPNLPLAQLPNSSTDLSSVDSSKLEQDVSVPQLQYALSGSDDDPDPMKDYFHTLTADSYGVISDVLKGGLKRDLTAGLGDENQFESNLAGMPIFKDYIPYRKDYDPLDWSKDGNRNLKWTFGFFDEMRWMAGPPWDIVKDYYNLYREVTFNSSDPLEARLAPRPVDPDSYPNRNGEFWTEIDNRIEPQTNAITPLLLEAKVGHTLEMVPTGDTNSKGVPLYRARIAIFPSLALWNPYNVELEAAQYELLWRPDPKFWVYPSNVRTQWSEAVMAYEVANNINRKSRYWDKNGDGRLSFRNYSKPHPNPPWWNPDQRVRVTEINTMHSLFLGSKRGRNIPYGQSPGQGGGGTNNISIGTGLRSVPRSMHRKAFHLYRYAPRPQEHESVSGWVRGNGHWHPVPGNLKFRHPLLLRTNPVRLAPGEKLYFTLAKSARFHPSDDHIFELRNHLGFQSYLHYNVPLKLCPPIPADEPVTFVYSGGGIGGYALPAFQREEELDAASKNPRVLGSALFMIKDGTRHPIKKINRGINSIGLNSGGSYQDYGRADIVVADPSRVIGPRLHSRLTTYHHNPELVFLEHNPRSLVDPWHLGQGDQWWRGQETDLDEGIGDTDLTDDSGVVFEANPNPDESLSGDFYSSGGRIYYGYQGHSFDVAGFHRVSRRNSEEQILPRSSRAVFFDIPRQPIMSLAALQHVNMCYFGNSPTYAIGNSYATSLVSRNRKWTRYNQLSVVPLDYAGSKKRGGNEHQNTIIDYSYYANETLWDSFFFSSVPTNDLNTGKFPPFENFDQDYIDSRKPLPNPRMVYYDGIDGLSPNDEMSPLEQLRDFHQAAANLLIDGAFNVNSTSVEAWKAQLGSLSQNKLLVRDMQDDYELAANGRKSTTLDFGSDQFPFPRLSVSAGEPVDPESGDFNQDFWTGFATLNEDQLHRLAEEIVQEVKFRGPFLSMGDFVNRRLSNPPGYQTVRTLHKSAWPNETEESRQGFRGALQAAIHDAGINDGGFRDRYGYDDPRVTNDMTRRTGLDFIPNNVGQFNVFGYSAAGLNHDATDQFNSSVTFHRRTNWGRGYDQSVRQRKVRYRDRPGYVEIKTSYHPRWGEHSHGEAPENMLSAANGVTGAMMPGWLSQADLLTPLAPVINVRSDTFKVRAYGDGGPANPDVKVWCEAIVQRLPEYVVNDVHYPLEGDPPYARPMEPYEDLNENGKFDGSSEPFSDFDQDETRSFDSEYRDQQVENPDNERFGRRFRIVKFRWLTADEV